MNQRRLLAWLLAFTALIVTSPAFSQEASAKSILTSGMLAEPVFNGSIYYSVRGNPLGEAVLLIHGLGDNASNMWQETARKLQHNYLVYSIDLPGFGRSDKGNRLYSPENYVRLIRFLRQSQINKPFHLIGHSMGAAISLRYAATYPQDIKTLTLIDAAGILYRLAYTKYLAPIGLESFTDKFSIDRQLTSSWAGRLLNKAEGLIQFDPEYLLTIPPLRAKILGGKPSTIAGLALVLDDFSQLPQKVEAPTQIIWGENDTIAPVRTAHVLKALIKDARFSMVENAAHNPVLEQPGFTHQLILSSLNSENTPVATTANPVPARSQAHCQKQKNIRYTGKITRLQLDHCSNALIENADIEQLTINHSSVHILNTRFDSKGTAISANHSDITITATSIDANIGIKINGTRLDIAGTTIIGKQSALVSSLPANVIFSLSRTSTQGQWRAVHGRIEVSPTNSL